MRMILRKTLWKRKTQEDPKEEPLQEEDPEEEHLVEEDLGEDSIKEEPKSKVTYWKWKV